MGKKRERISTGFGERLRAIREKKGLTLAAVGEAAGLHFQAIARLERGEVEPTWPTVLKLAEALKVPVGKFHS